MARRASVEFDTTEFVRGVKRLGESMEDAAAREVARVGEEVARDAASRAPRRTGRLAGSIRSVAGRDSDGAYADVEVGSFLGHFWEFGTSKLAARPFLRPALERVPSLLRPSNIGRR